MAVVNWSREETFRLISIWSEDVIQEQLEGCRRNSSVYRKIADGLREAGFSRTLEQCRDKIKKLKAEYKKIRDKRDTTGQGRYPEWEFFDALDEVLGPKHSTEPPVLLESFQSDRSQISDIGPDDETQDMSEGVVNEPTASNSSPGTPQTSQSETFVDDAKISSCKPKSKKRKLGKREATNEILEKMVEMQQKSDTLMANLEEKRMKMEEKQMELDAQMRREEREFQLRMMQVFAQYNTPHPGLQPQQLPYPPAPFGAYNQYDPDATQDGL